MKRVLLKIGLLSLYGIFCAFLISEAKVNSKAVPNPESHGKYAIQSTGNLDQNLAGDVHFETSFETDKNRNSTSILKLKLACEDNALEHTIEFLIAKDNTSNQISKGSYLITPENGGFIKNFDGVFGFANINALGELPFFAKSGEVRIDFADDVTVIGTLNVSLRNANGKSIKLAGDFVALK